MRTGICNSILIFYDAAFLVKLEKVHVHVFLQNNVYSIPNISFFKMYNKFLGHSDEQ